MGSTSQTGTDGEIAVTGQERGDEREECFQARGQIGVHVRHDPRPTAFP